MKRRSIAFLLGFLSVGLAGFFFFEYIYDPLPDTTDFESAEKLLFTIGSLESTIAAALFYYIGWAPPIDKVKKPLILAAIFQALFLIAIFGIRYYLFTTLNHGQGG